MTVDRRRTARRLRSASAAVDRDRRLAARMARRFHSDGQPIAMLLLDYRYWQARRCRWDANANGLRTVGGDRRTGPATVCDPTESNFWRWWTSLHYGTRAQLARLSDFRLTVAVPLPAWSS